VDGKAWKLVSGAVFTEEGRGGATYRFFGVRLDDPCDASTHAGAGGFVQVRGPLAKGTHEPAVMADMARFVSLGGGGAFDVATGDADFVVASVGPGIVRGTLRASAEKGRHEVAGVFAVENCTGEGPDEDGPADASPPAPKPGASPSPGATPVATPPPAPLPALDLAKLVAGGKWTTNSATWVKAGTSAPVAAPEAVAEWTYYAPTRKYGLTVTVRKLVGTYPYPLYEVHAMGETSFRVGTGGELQGECYEGGTKWKPMGTREASRLSVTKQVVNSSLACVDTPRKFEIASTPDGGWTITFLDSSDDDGRLGRRGNAGTATFAPK
jgi:hypothetical protein